MAESNSGQEKTERATPKRREDALKKGQVAKSRDLPAAMSLLVIVGFFWFGGGDMLGRAGDLMRVALQHAVQPEMTIQQMQQILMDTCWEALSLLTPLMLVMVIIGIVGHLVQTGPIGSLHPLMPKFSKINPAEGVKRLLSVTTLMEGVKSVLKLVMVCVPVGIILKGETNHLPELAGMPYSTLLPYLGTVAFKIVVVAGFLLLILGLIDLAFQRFQHEKKLRMTMQEVKQELKESEGDPMVRARIRTLQREAAKKRMMSDVPDADVVVTNPTHLAIAIKYSPDSHAAPLVVAKGAGHIAARIREIARDAGVPVMEDKPLARALFKGVEVGGEIPLDLYQAVAEVLAFVYRINKSNAPTGQMAAAQ